MEVLTADEIVRLSPPERIALSANPLQFPILFKNVRRDPLQWQKRT
jgi:hypothetical protein